MDAGDIPASEKTVFELTGVYKDQRHRWITSCIDHMSNVLLSYIRNQSAYIDPLTKHL